MRWTRRRFLGAAGAAAAGAVLGACRGDDGAGGTSTTTTSTTAPPQPPATLAPIDHGEPRGSPPFGLGVASGDPDDTSVVLWTWVDRDAGTVPVTVEVALDQAFTRIVARQRVTAEADSGMTARSIVAGLTADTIHWYRFAADGHVTEPARTRTAPAPGELPAAPLRLGHLSCQRWSAGYWTALDDVADQAPDLVVHCGDYVYEDDSEGVRTFDGEPPTDLDGYRALWRRYRSEPELQAAHAVAPWLVVWDDHEVENGYQGTVPGDPPDGAAFLDQRAAAYRAWWEFTPTRLPAPEGPSLPIHRVLDWGRLARFVLLDTRQHRDPQPCDGGLADDLGARCDGTEQAAMLGDEQERWLGEVVEHDRIWTSVVQQVVVHQWRLLPGNVVWNLDQWDGYTGSRRRLLDALTGAPAPVVLTGDVHSSWVAQLHRDPDDDGSPVVGAELVAPGVSSQAPSHLRLARPAIEAQSPHVRWAEVTRRGWVLHEVDADAWVASYRLVDAVDVPGAPVRVASRWSVDPGSVEVAET